MPFQSVHNYPHEQTRRKTARRCRADWYANAEAVCGYAYDSAGHKIFDSQVTVTKQRDKFTKKYYIFIIPIAGILLLL